jgi:hypothetical protein
MSMGIVNELQSSAEVDDVLTLIRKAKRVASKLVRDDISKWLGCEQNGYTKSEDLPDYRRIPSEFAYDTNGYIPAGYGMAKSGITRIGKMGMDIRIPISDSIGAVMDLIEKADSGKGNLFHPCSSDTSRTIKALFKSPFPEIIDQIVIMHQLDMPSVKDIPNQVKNRILDWALDLERAGIHGEDHTFTQTERTMAESVTFNDHSTTIQTGSVQGALQVNSPEAFQSVSISVGEIEKAIRKIESALAASDEIDNVDKQDIGDSLNTVRNLSAKEHSEKAKLKIAEKISAIATAVSSCAKLAPVVKPLLDHLKSALHLI